MKVYQLKIVVTGVPNSRKKQRLSALSWRMPFLSIKVFPSEKSARKHIPKFKANIRKKLPSIVPDLRGHDVNLTSLLARRRARIRAVRRMYDPV